MSLLGVAEDIGHYSSRLRRLQADLIEETGELMGVIDGLRVRLDEAVAVIGEVLPPGPPVTRWQMRADAVMRAHATGANPIPDGSGTD